MRRRYKAAIVLDHTDRMKGKCDFAKVVLPCLYHRREVQVAARVKQSRRGKSAETSREDEDGRMQGRQGGCWRGRRSFKKRVVGAEGSGSTRVGRLQQTDVRAGAGTS